MHIVFSGLPADIAGSVVVGRAMRGCAQVWSTQFFGDRYAVVLKLESNVRGEGACIRVSSASGPADVRLRAELVHFMRRQLFKLVPRGYRLMVAQARIEFI